MSLDLRRERSPAISGRPGAGPLAGSGHERDPEPSVRHPTVTAVVVARRSEHLAPVLHGLHDQTRPPDQVIGIDAGDDPATMPVLRAGTAHVLVTAATATTGDAVTAALAARDADALAPTPDPRPAPPAALASRPSGPEPSDAEPPDPEPSISEPSISEPSSSEPSGPEPSDLGREWVWVLGDRSVPHPRALEELLRAVGRSPQVGVAGCKHRAGSRGLELVEAGSTMTRWGRRLTGVEPGEPDQGQLDDREDVLAVPTVGMLVARDVWDALHGTDPALEDAGADLDLGRRARLAGHRVVVVPRAVMTRPDAPRPAPTTTTALHRHPAARARHNAAYLRLAAAPWWALPGVALSVLLGGVLRSMLGLAAKEPTRGAAALTGAVGALSRPRHLLRSRRRAARTRTVPRRDLRSLHAGPAEVGRWHRDRWADRRPDPGQPLAAATLLDPPVPADPATRRTPHRATGWGVVALLTLLTAASFAAMSALVGGGPVTAAALQPVPDSARELWDAARSGWVPAGVGHRGPADPLLAVLAAVAAGAGLVGASPSAAVAGLLLAALPGAGLAAWWAAGAVTRRPPWRLAAALAWAAAPSLLLAVDAGRLGAVLAHVALPVAVRCAAAAALSPHRRAGWSWAGCAALALVPVTAGAPVLLLPAVVLAALVAAVSRRPGVLAAVLPSLALAGPGLASALAGLAGPDAAGPAAAGPGAAGPDGPDARSWQLALGWPQAPQAWPALPPLPGIGDLGAAPLLAAAAVPVLLALVAVPWALRTGRQPAAVRWGLALSVVGLLAAVVAARVVPPGTEPVAAGGAAGAWPGSATSLVVVGLLVAGLAGTRGRPVPSGPVRTAAAATWVVLLAVVPLVGVLAWSAAHAVGEAPGPRRGADPALPAAVVDTATSPDQARVLALRAGGDRSLGVSLLRGDGPALESAGRAAPPRDAADAALDRSTVALVSGVGDPRQALAPFGVGAVVVLPERPDDAPPGAGSAAAGAAAPLGTTPQTTEGLVAALDATAALTPSGRLDGLRAWRVEAAGGTASTSPDRPAALRLVAPDGTATALPSSPFGARTDVDAGPAGRTLALAERRDAGWTATLDGRELGARTVDGWAQGWDLPTGGGRLDVRYESSAAPWWGPLQAVLLVLAALVAVPVLRAPRSARAATGSSV